MTNSTDKMGLAAAGIAKRQNVFFRAQKIRPKDFLRYSGPEPTPVSGQTTGMFFPRVIGIPVGIVQFFFVVVLPIPARLTPEDTRDTTAILFLRSRPVLRMIPETPAGAGLGATLSTGSLLAPYES